MKDRFVVIRGWGKGRHKGECGYEKSNAKDSQIG